MKAFWLIMVTDEEIQKDIIAQLNKEISLSNFLTFIILFQACYRLRLAQQAKLCCGNPKRWYEA